MDKSRFQSPAVEGRVRSTAKRESEPQSHACGDETEVAIQVTNEKTSIGLGSSPIGLQAGGLAHDLDSLLTAIVSCAARLRNRLAPRDPAHGDLDAIVAAAGRGEELTRKLLEIGREDPGRTRLPAES